MRLKGRIALITGASRGLGAAVAERFAAEGAHIIAIARTKGGLDALDDAVRAAGGAGATLATLDLAAGESVEALVLAIHDRYRRLDILVANAGVLGTLTPLRDLTTERWEHTLAVNVTANWRLLRACDPLLRRSGAGRVIVVSSVHARCPRAYWGAYAASKAALESLAMTYAHEVAATSIQVNVIDPGPLRTRFRATAFPGERPDRLREPREVTSWFVELGDSACAVHGQHFALATRSPEVTRAS